MVHCPATKLPFHWVIQTTTPIFKDLQEPLCLPSHIAASRVQKLFSAFHLAAPKRPSPALCQLQITDWGSFSSLSDCSSFSVLLPTPLSFDSSYFLSTSYHYLMLFVFLPTCYLLPTLKGKCFGVLCSSLPPQNPEQGELHIRAIINTRTPMNKQTPGNT